MRTELSKKIEKLCSVSKITSNPKEVFDHLMILGFNLLNEGSLNLIVRTFQHIKCNQDFVVELDVYKKDLKAWDLLQECFVEYLKEIRNNDLFDDVIGLQYDQYLGKVLGQFLTPKAIADGGCQMALINSMSELIEKQKHFNVGDICCGAGALQLGVLRQIYERHGEEGLRYVHLIANDIDVNMVRMCSVQIVLPCIVHSVSVGSFESTNYNIITQYKEFNTENNPAIRVIRNLYDYSIYIDEKNKIKVDTNFG